MRFEFQTDFREQYIATLTVLRRIPLQMAVSIIFPFFGLLLLVSSLIAGSLGPANIVLISFMLGFTPLMTAFSVWLYRRRNKTAAGPFVYLIDQQGITISGRTFELKLAWQGILKVVETKRFFLFFTSPQMAQFLPKRCIPSAQELQE